MRVGRTTDACCGPHDRVEDGSHVAARRGDRAQYIGDRGLLFAGARQLGFEVAGCVFDHHPPRSPHATRARRSLRHHRGAPSAYFCANVIPHETLRAAPKVLLHDHLDGGLRPATVIELAREQGYAKLPTVDADELARWFHA